MILKLEEIEFQKRLIEAKNSTHREIILEEKKAKLFEDISKTSNIYRRIEEENNTKCMNTFNKYFKNDQSIHDNECCKCAEEFKIAKDKSGKYQKIYDELIARLQPIEGNKNGENMPLDITEPLNLFYKDYPQETNTAFLVMQFKDSGFHNQIVTQIKETCKNFGIIALRADDKEYADDLFSNVKTYMHACKFGIAVFERITEDDINPNVSLEVGYILGMGKKVCLLKDRSLKQLQTDLAGKLYKPFDLQKIKESIDTQLTKWIQDKFID